MTHEQFAQVDAFAEDPVDHVDAARPEGPR
jgi:hypothetical protein